MFICPSSRIKASQVKRKGFFKIKKAFEGGEIILWLYVFWLQIQNIFAAKGINHA